MNKPPSIKASLLLFIFIVLPGGCFWFGRQTEKDQRAKGWMTFRESVDDFTSRAKTVRDNRAYSSGDLKEFLLSFNEKITKCHDDNFLEDENRNIYSPSATSLYDPNDLRPYLEKRSINVLYGCYKALDDELRLQNSVAVRNARWSMKTLLGGSSLSRSAQGVSVFSFQERPDDILGYYKGKPPVAPEECNQDWIVQFLRSSSWEVSKVVLDIPTPVLTLKVEAIKVGPDKNIMPSCPSLGVR